MMKRVSSRRRVAFQAYACVYKNFLRYTFWKVDVAVTGWFCVHADEREGICICVHRKYRAHSRERPIFFALIRPPANAAHFIFACVWKNDVVLLQSKSTTTTALQQTREHSSLNHASLDVCCWCSAVLLFIHFRTNNDEMVSTSVHLY